MSAVLGTRSGYPIEHMRPNIRQHTVRCTVSAGPTFTMSHVDYSLTDETGTGAYSLNFPPGKTMSVVAQVEAQGGSTALLIAVVGGSVPNNTTAKWAFTTYNVTTATSHVALADLVAGDVIDFQIEGEYR
jgi:hypothetical protein